MQPIDPWAVPSPPEASRGIARAAARLVSPIERFLHIEAASGIVLLVTTALAMIAANTTAAHAYHSFVEMPIGLRVGGVAIEHSLHFWVNDGLMTIFFFVVGLEIRREIHGGELSTMRRAALPIVAAFGGMLVPAIVYLATVGFTGPNARGWAIPMATDIAFAVGVLALLGKRVPPALRVLLLALAIIDDIGGIIVIALFYSGPLAANGLLLAALGVAAILVMQRAAVRRPALYVVPAFVVWLGLLRSGIHPTIGGVLVGLLTPARAWFGAEGLASTVRSAASRLERPSAAALDEAPRLDLARREAVSPAERLQHLLHPWVAFAIMPLFAFVNAGVTLDVTSVAPSAVGLGIVLGLVIGKPVGIVATALLAVRVGLAQLPRSLGKREIVVLGIVAGIGFTMSLFIAALAFPDAAKLDAAKTAVLAASMTAMIVSLVAGRVLCAVRSGEAVSASEAEASDVE